MSAPYVRNGNGIDARKTKMLAQRQALLNKRRGNRRNLGLQGLARTNTNFQAKKGTAAFSSNSPTNSFVSPASPRSAGVRISFSSSKHNASPRSHTVERTEYKQNDGSVTPGPHATGVITPIPRVSKGNAAEEVERNMRIMGISATYDPTTKKPKGKTADSSFPLGDKRAFLTRPLRQGTKAMCNIKRIQSKKKFGGKPVYECYILDGNQETFIMFGKKRPKNKTSNYIISMAKGEAEKDSPNFLGKLRSNMLGTEFIVFDDGIKAKEAKGKDSKKSLRTELGLITYEPNLLFNRGPRVMTIIVPNARSKTQFHKYMAEEKGALKCAYNSDPKDKKLFVLCNKKPKWNQNIRAYCLNFHGRVTLPSVKNFQVSNADNEEHVVLQFGKVGEHEFTLDLTYPLSPLQAFAVALSSFDNKKVVD
ncbi:hypothetical protein AAMO2058_000155800 [Amorphochlora amoebiformis]